ncbi:TonB family protein [Roseibacterium beibuensis]|uniref:TonB family protein n=1 Tax=[Roseibacterium] beibuensis TaxID=1193142 RepID=UPI00217E1B7D|nr:TonB family protein [Roseibacterium beibuensis]MCS6624805.1 TonB family protein [Roseibacterium beibuensis]
MTAPQLLALSLGVSIAAAGLGLFVMRALEGRVADPVLRERAWATALYLPALPPLLIALVLLAPAPTQIAAPALAASSTVLVDLQAASGLAFDPAQTTAVALLVLAGLFALLRTVSLGLRLMRLRRRIAATAPAASDLRGAVEQAARRIGVAAPTVRIGGPGGEALLAGLLRPVLIVPSTLAATPDSAPTRAVCAHELAHLKRGDHRALWIEEVLLAALAINPLLRIIRDHRGAAREEACDALALAGADDAQRRLYARSLLDAVRTAGFQHTAPALTFTSARRTFVMNRLKAVLAPASPAGPRSRRATVGLAALIAGVVGAGSLAVAAQRQPVIVEPTTDIAVAPPAPTAPSPRPAAVARPAPAAPSAPLPAPADTPRPQPAVAPAPAAAATPLPAAAPAQDAPAEISRVTWAQHPAPMYPALAAANGVTGGVVTLTCTVKADGAAADCAVVSEDPEGQGFGAAALASMERARFSPRTLEGTSPGAKARFTIRFRLAE